MEQTLLITYACLALGVSFFCSLMEAILLSTTPSFVSVSMKDGNKTGALWNKLKADDSVKALTAILTLNTVAHTIGAVGVGSQVQLIYGEKYLTIASVILTLGVLILSEIIPKTLGSAYWKQLSAPAAYMTYYLTLLTTPIVVPIEGLKKLLPHAKTTTVTRDELAVLADIGEEEGEIEEDEERVITNLLRLADIPITDVMTPRVVVTSFPHEYTVRQVLDEIPVLRVSRIPVYGESIDDLKGLVIRSNLLTLASQDDWDVQLKEITQPLECVNEDASVDAVLDLLLKKRQQMVAVIDEFGGTSGIVTMEDVIETLLGEEIIDETDEAEDMRELARELSENTSEE